MQLGWTPASLPVTFTGTRLSTANQSTLTEQTDVALTAATQGQHLQPSDP